jgi:signal transduction histidine kinase
VIFLPDRAHAVIMDGVSPVRTAWLTAAAIAGAVAASLAGVSASVWAAVTDHQSRASAGLFAAVIVAFAVTGAVVVAARPRNPVGWVMLAGAALSSLGNGGAALAHHGIVAAPGSLGGASAYAVAGQSCRSLGWYLLTLGVPAIFPSGRLPRPGWRWLRRLLPAVLIASVVGPLTDTQADLTGLGDWQNPIAPPPGWQFVNTIAFLTQVPLGLVAAGGIVALLVSRWRRGDARLRQQIRLFVAAAAVPVAAVPIVFAVGLDAGPWVFGATALPLPFAIGFAVLGRGLYDLRTAVNRTLVWVTLSSVVAGIYALAIAGLGNRLDVRHSTWLPWVAAGLVAVSFAPLRDALQRGVNRLTFGRWEEPYDVLAALGQRLEATADVTRLLEQVVEELHGLGLAEVALLDAHGDVLAGAAAAPGERIHLPLAAYGQRVGALSYHPPATPLRTRDRQLLEDLAGHLGGVLHAHELTLDAQRARERLVLAREEERRRLRRDVHDGLGPSLAGHLLRLDVIAAKLGHESSVAPDVETLREELRATMLDVRRVVEGLRPPALDELGLAGALNQVAARLTGGTCTVITVEVDELPPLPAAIEVATFRIFSEAVTNVVRHANASTCSVAITAEHGRLRLEVRDDGRGLAGPPISGHGLQTMRERAEELRGQLSVRSGNGTVVVAELPMLVAQRPVPAESAPVPS